MCDCRCRSLDESDTPKEVTWTELLRVITSLNDCYTIAFAPDVEFDTEGEPPLIRRVSSKTALAILLLSHLGATVSEDNKTIRFSPFVR